MQKIITVIIITMCAISIYSCKKASTTSTTIVVTDPADSFVGTWNAVDTSYYYGTKTDFPIYNFTIHKTAANKITLIGWPYGKDSSHATVTTTTMVIAEDSTVVQVLNPRVFTYYQKLYTFPDFYILGKATKL